MFNMFNILYYPLSIRRVRWNQDKRFNGTLVHLEGTGQTILEGKRGALGILRSQVLSLILYYGTASASGRGDGEGSSSRGGSGGSGSSCV